MLTYLITILNNNQWFLLLWIRHLANCLSTSFLSLFITTLDGQQS